MSVFEKMESGTLFVPGQEMDLGAISWSPHAAFEGIALKHLLTAKDTQRLRHFLKTGQLEWVQERKKLYFSTVRKTDHKGSE